jgi:hypothetical protein
MAPQPLEKTESRPGNGMGSEALSLLDLVHAAGRLDSRKGGAACSSFGVAELQKKELTADNSSIDAPLFKELRNEFLSSPVVISCKSGEALDHISDASVEVDPGFGTMR